MCLVCMFGLSSGGYLPTPDAEMFQIDRAALMIQSLKIDKMTFLSFPFLHFDNSDSIASSSLVVYELFGFRSPGNGIWEMRNAKREIQAREVW